MKDLADLRADQLVVAINRARRELKFFPKVAELRELAGAGAQDVAQVEAESAFEFAQSYLRKYGVDLLPTYRDGEVRLPPPLPARIDYAVRRIGGLRGLNQITLARGQRRASGN